MKNKRISFYILIPFLIEVKTLLKLINFIKRGKNFRYVKKVIIVTPNKLIKNFIKKSTKIKIIIERHRKGKFSAINTGLKFIKENEWILLLSSDIVLEKNSIDHLIKRLMIEDSTIVGGITGRVLPSNKYKKYWLSKVIWDLHHYISLYNPKASEIFLFKKVFKKIPKVINDDVIIEFLIRKKGLKIIYEPECCGFTAAPNTLRYFLAQRERIFCGHLEAFRRFRYLPETVKIKNLLHSLNIYLRRKGLKDWILFFLVVIIEIIARLSAIIKFFFKLHKKSIIWWKEFY